MSLAKTTTERKVICKRYKSLKGLLREYNEEGTNKRFKDLTEKEQKQFIMWYAHSKKEISKVKLLSDLDYYSVQGAPYKKYNDPNGGKQYKRKSAEEIMDSPEKGEDKITLLIESCFESIQMIRKNRGYDNFIREVKSEYPQYDKVDSHTQSALEEVILWRKAIYKTDEIDMKQPWISSSTTRENLNSLIPSGELTTTENKFQTFMDEILNKINNRALTKEQYLTLKKFQEFSQLYDNSIKVLNHPKSNFDDFINALKIQPQTLKK